ncbi:hypothetical protein SSCG_02198 [Streptomyces clavuligerus]|nr:hypothetical protein SSCG_02198 [Streptomyces clavuligerus]
MSPRHHDYIIALLTSHYRVLGDTCTTDLDPVIARARLNPVSPLQPGRTEDDVVPRRPPDLVSIYRNAVDRA